MKSVFRAALVGVALLTTASAHTAAPLKSLHVVYNETNAPAKGKAMSRTGEIWLKNNKLRVRQGELIIISDGRRAVAFSPADPQKRKQTVNIPKSQQGTSVLASLNQMVNPMLKKMKKTGTGKILGHSTNVYAISDPKLKATRRTWVATNLGASLLLRDETKTPQGTYKMEATSVRVNPALPDSLFSPPAGFKEVQPPKPAGKSKAPAKR